MPDDDNMFAQEMADVQPIRRSQRIQDKPTQGDDPSLAARRAAAVTETGQDPNYLVEEGVEPLDPWYVLEFKRPGVQNGVYRKLKQGRYDTEARLDMHRMTVKIARRELYRFIEDCQRLGLRTVLVVHGRGDRGKADNKVSVLKGYTRHWLQQLHPVMAFHSARPEQGGTGAVLVLLRKSEDKKRENRERFLKGRVPNP